MKAIKQLLQPQRLRRVPEQFSWVDQALVQQRYIDRCEARSAALYLFLVTVSDSQGLSYYGRDTLARRLRLTQEQLDAARQQLIELELIAYRAPLYQVLALPRAVTALGPPPRSSPAARGGAAVNLATLLQMAQQRRT